MNLLEIIVMAYTTITLFMIVNVVLVATKKDDIKTAHVIVAILALLLWPLVLIIVIVAYQEVICPYKTSKISNNRRYQL